jgi:HAD superfamily hydrolase (TIGR01549 family)
VAIRALTLDLDDTLWPVWPAIERAEIAVQEWLAEHAPRTARGFPLERMRHLRDAVARDNPGLAHDFTAQRKLALATALRESGEDEALCEAAFAVFVTLRNRVELFPDVPEALARLSARFPIAALTNGNADLARIGLRPHFAFQLGAREHGVAKPHASIFHAACERLDCAPHQVLHIGDDPEADVRGARRAGLRCAFIDRAGNGWHAADSIEPDFIVRDLAELADRLDHWLAAA